MRRYALLCLLAAGCAHGGPGGAAAADAAWERGHLSAQVGLRGAADGGAGTRLRGAGTEGGAGTGVLDGDPGQGGGAAGAHALDLGGERDGFVYAPPSYRPGRPMPLVLMLHGAGGRAERVLEALRPLADARGFLLLAPDAREATWDAISGAYGPDVRFIDGALRAVLARYSVDPQRIAVAGFSDGGSYALALGLGNGELFCCVAAFSPGMLPAVERRGAPRIFLSHGTEDQVLPIDQCSRRIAPALAGLGLEVRYVEFAGRHEVPDDIARQGIDSILR